MTQPVQGQNPDEVTQGRDGGLRPNDTFASPDDVAALQALVAGDDE